MRVSAPAGSWGEERRLRSWRGGGGVWETAWCDVDAGTVRWLHVFSPRMTNEVRGQLARDLEYERPHAPLAQEPAIGPGGFAPEVSIQGGEFMYGTPAALGRNAYPDERRVEVADVMQWAAGPAVVRWVGIGGGWRSAIDALNDVDGTFTYDSGCDGRARGWAGGLDYGLHVQRECVSERRVSFD